MARKQLTQTIMKFLRENGECSTREVYEHINSSTKWGASSNAIGQILRRNPEVEEVGKESYIAFTGDKSRKVIVWRLKNL